MAKSEMSVQTKHLVLALVFGLACAACGGNSTAPTPAPTPTVSALTVTGNDAIRTTFYADYVATATLSTGTTQVVTNEVRWTSSNATIGSIDTVVNPGRLIGNSHGTITLTATYLDITATKGVSVVNNYGGTWSGTYIIRKCTQSSVFAGWCAGLGGVGAILPFSLSLNQAISNDRRQISGTISLGALGGNISGNVTADGRLVIGGSYNVTSGGIASTMTIGGWDTRLSGASRMTGQWTESLSAIGATGNAYMENSIWTSTHTAPQVAGPVPAPVSYQLTIGEALARMREPD